MVRIVTQHAVPNRALGWTTQNLTSYSPTTLTQQHNWPYHGFGVGNDGSTLFIAYVDPVGLNTNVKIDVLCRYGGAWYSQLVTPSDGFRYTYYMWAPTSNAGGYLLGTQDVYNSDRGWVGGTSYVWPKVVAWYSANWTTTAPTEIFIYQVTQTAGGFVQCWCRHCRIGPDGALYVTGNYTPDNGAGTNQAFYARVVGTTVASSGIATALTAVAPTPNFPTYLSDGVNLFMMCTHDGSGGGSANWFYIFACDANGSPTGTPTILLPAQGAYNFVASVPQSGSPDTTFVDVLYVSEAVAPAGLSTHCMRINLSGTPSIVFDELVNSSGATDDGGNNWGLHHLRCARSPGGKLYVTAHTGTYSPDTNTPTTTHSDTIYQRTGTNTWTAVHSEGVVREPACIAVSGEHTIYVENWPIGAPNISVGTV